MEEAIIKRAQELAEEHKHQMTNQLYKKTKKNKLIKGAENQKQISQQLRKKENNIRKEEEKFMKFKKQNVQEQKRKIDLDEQQIEEKKKVF